MVVGIIGGIGAGKSTVTRMLAALGAETVDADLLAHEALEAPHVRQALRAWLGEEVVGRNGKVDRKAVADQVFAFPEKLKYLESLVHPEVLRRIEERVEDHASRGAPAPLVLDVPLLMGSPLGARCDEIVFVEAGPGVRRGRVKGRGWGPGEIERRERMQMATEEKRRLADHVIDNSRSLEETRRQVEALFRGWKKYRKEGGA